MRRLSVLLTTEGTFPFHKGGVSTWCDVLTRQLSEIDFTLLAVTMNPFVQPCYQVAPNVRSVLMLPLWGIEDPAEYHRDRPFSIQLERRWATTEEIVEREFVPGFERLLWGGLGHAATPEETGYELLMMHRYFQRYDYRASLYSRQVWDSFERSVLAIWRAARPSGAPDPALAELVEALRLLYHLLLVLNVEVPDVDVAHSAAAAFCGLPCVMAKLERGIPYLLTEHGVYLREQYLGLRRHVKSFFVRWFLYRVIGMVASINYYFADQVSPVCADNARWEAWWGVPKDRLRVIYNGADPSRFCPAPSSRPATRRPSVASVGLIFPLKGQINLIEAAALVRRDIPDIEVRLYGSPSDDRYYEQCQASVRAHQLEGTVVFAGSTPTPWEVYREADIVASPSLSDACPYSVIEAMLTGSAIVATDVGGVREALADTGVLVRPRQPAELAAAIVSLLRAPSTRARLGAAARARALRFFTQETFLNAYRETYAVLSTRQPSRTASPR
jgi:glycosyltransferase involved in cell wall biosynthesis